ncbi:MAG: hypothetical protein OEY51_01385 [Cyclobacteriaceae bacterium]|nr:hypothetical protein [Cyclobacteriaceae bacterium]
MSLRIELTAKFKRKAKALLKKYPSFKEELEELIFSLEKNPTLGVSINPHYSWDFVVKAKRPIKTAIFDAIRHGNVA